MFRTSRTASIAGVVLPKAAVIACIGFAACPAAAVPPSSEGIREADFLDWARQNAIRLDSLDRRETPPTAFAFLDEALKGKRVVYLGETDHFVAERMEFRLLLIRELARRGFRRIGMEMGLSDGKRMDRFLRTGDAKWLDRIALYGYRGDMRTDRKDEVPGWTDDSHTEFTSTILDEAKWFLHQLRQINEELPEGEPRLKWFGYDLSFRPGGGYADAQVMLDPYQKTPLVQEILEGLTRVPGESRLEEAARLEAIVAILDEHRIELEALIGEVDALELRRALQRMADAFRFIDALQDLRNFDAKAVGAALSARERRMYHNFDEHLAEWPSDENIILLGHALHLSKDSESIRTQSFDPMWKSIGTYLTEKRPGEVYGIWLLHDHGRHGLARGVPPIQSFCSPQNSIERLLAKIHPILMLPLGSSDPRKSWLDEERTFSYSGAPAQAVLPRQTDCLFFVETANEPGKRRCNALRTNKGEQRDYVQLLPAEDEPDLRQLNIESFEEVFRIVHDRFWDPTFGGLDWKAVGDELRPRIMKATTLPEARAILRDMISRLKLSHFAIIPTDSRQETKRCENDGAPEGETGIDARVIGGKALVTSVAEGSSAERLGVRPGWEIIRINEFDVVAHVKKLDRELPDTPSKRVKMTGDIVVRVRSGQGDPVAVTFRDGEGDLVDLTIPFGEPRGRNATVGNFGHARVRIDVKIVGDNIGYIAINKFLNPAYVMRTFDDVLESFMEMEGIILDLRGNSGGKDAIALSMMGWLAPSEWVAGRLRTRGNETKMIVRPRARTFDGPVAVLTDGLTGSSAEFVAATLQEMGRACVIGTRTKGEALPGEYTTLPNGDVFLYAVSDFLTGAGKRLEGVGVAPDIEVALTQASLLDGRDIVLEAAINWIGTQEYTPRATHEPAKGKDSIDRRGASKLDRESVAKFLGFYRDERNGLDYEMVFQDGGLAIRVPGMPTPLAFDPPDADGYWVLQVNPLARIRFNEDNGGRVVSYTVYTPAGNVVRPRNERDSKP